MTVCVTGAYCRACDSNEQEFFITKMLLLVVCKSRCVLPQDVHWQGVDADADAVADGAALPYFSSHEMMLL
jgi:hypothetical protein